MMHRIAEIIHSPTELWLGAIALIAMRTFAVFVLKSLIRRIVKFDCSKKFFRNLKRSENFFRRFTGISLWNIKVTRKVQLRLFIIILWIALITWILPLIMLIPALLGNQVPFNFVARVAYGFDIIICGPVNMYHGLLIRKYNKGER